MGSLKAGHSAAIGVDDIVAAQKAICCSLWAHMLVQHQAAHMAGQHNE